jgi:3-isopropylmalate/(R)-2-methylmalate dehydratase small subunit
MERVTKITGIAAPLMLVNIDTDAIIPGKELMKVTKSGYGDGLFAGWRYLDQGRRENPEFVLNIPPYGDAKILLAGRNFACGSSREVAVWALKDFGIRCVIAPSFGFIFYSNCFKNGLLPVVLRDNDVEKLASQVKERGGTGPITVDLESCIVIGPDGDKYFFSIAKIYRDALLGGLDVIDATLKFVSEIARFQRLDRKKRPWLYT